MLPAGCRSRCRCSARRRAPTFYNGQDGRARVAPSTASTNPAPIYDAEGALVVTTTIRAHGALDFDTPEGVRYTGYSPDGDYTGPARILKAGRLWRYAATDDDVKAGILRTDVRGAGRDPVRESIEYRYDALTGVVQNARRF